MLLFTTAYFFYFQTWVFVQNDSNAVLLLPEGRLDKVWLSFPQNGGVTARRPPTTLQDVQEDVLLLQAANVIYKYYWTTVSNCSKLRQSQMSNMQLHMFEEVRYLKKSYPWLNSEEAPRNKQCVEL